MAGNGTADASSLLGNDPTLIQQFTQALAAQGGGSNQDAPLFWAPRDIPVTGTQPYLKQGGPGQGGKSARTVPRGMTTSSSTMLQSQAYFYLDQMRQSDPEKYQKIVNMLVAAGLVSANPSPQQVDSNWQYVVDKAALYYQNDPNTTMSPFAVLDTMAKDAGSVGGRKMQTTRSVHTYDQSQIAGSNETLSANLLGRAPTAAENATAQSAVNSAAQANPDVSTTTYDANGNASTVSSGGIDPNQILRQQAQANPDYGAYQAATTYFNALQSLLGPANATGG